MAVKTEHNGAKRGKGAFWGRKRDAKAISKRARRVEDRRRSREDR